MASWWISPHQWGCFLPGAEIEGGLSFAARLEDRIREALNVQEEATEEITVQNADDAPLDLENDFDLQAQTEEQRAQQEAEIKAAAEAEAKAKRKADEAERKRKEQEADKARADETVDSFELGQSSDEAMSGMGDMFSQQAQDGQQLDGSNTALKFSRKADSDAVEGQRQFKETERAYGGKDAYDRAKKAGKTKLNYQQWVQVRTPAFKEWFGDWEVASAKLERKAGNFTEARQAAKAFQGKPLTNRGTGIVATVSRNNLDKMLSQKSVGKSASPALHSAAVANLDSMFERAVLGWSKPDSEGDPNIKAIHRFFTPVLIDGKAMMAKMTVKETVQDVRPNPLYTVEAVSFEKLKNPAAQWVGEIAEADGIDPRTTRSAGLVESMAQNVQQFNTANVSKVTDPETGEPMAVKHGSRESFTQFKESRGGMYFTTDGSAATAIFTEGGAGEVGEYYLSLKNPFDARWKNMSNDQKAELREIIESVVDDSDIEGAAAKLEVPIEDADPFEVFTDGEFFWGYGRNLQNSVMEEIKRRGYDGVIFPDAITFGEEHVSYVAFRSDQIKSATGNVGTFRKDTDNITRSQRQQPKPTGSTVQGIRDSLRKTYGKLIDKLEASGKVKLVQGIDDAIDAAAKARAAITGQSVESIKQSLMASVQNQIAYHGTPYRGIEQTGFKLNKIGSGEGAQAYGWGIYFAGKKDVAELYRDALARKYAYKDSPVVRAAGEQLWEMLHARSNRGDRAVISEGKYYFDARTKESFLNDWLTDPSITRMPEQKEAVEKVLTGQLYRAEVPEDSDLLDYDKPLSQQPKKVRDALLKLNDAVITKAMTTEPASMDDGEYWSFMGNTYSTKREALEDYTPERLVTGRLGNFKSPQAVAEAMQSVGIPGLRYLDGNSRNAGEGSHNYVIWDEALLTPEAAQIEPLYSSNGDVEGFYDPQAGQSYLIADALTEETAPGTLMHEVGIHMAADGAHMTELFGRAEQLLNQYPNNPFMRRVKQRMEEAGETSAEEAAAYIVTEYENNRALAPKTIGQFVKDMLAAIRGWMFRNGYGIKAGSLTAADIAAVARANAKAISKPAKGQGVRRSFAGQQSKTANKYALATAQRRIEAGENAEQVRQDTGWHKGNDGKWRYEISDDQAKMKKPYPEKGQAWGDIHKAQLAQGKYSTVGDMLEHPALFAAYPQLESIAVTQHKGGGARLEVNPRTKEQVISVGDAVVMSDMVSKLLHELQHSIQTQEGFAVGGNINSVDREAFPAFMKRLNDILKTAEKSEKELIKDRDEMRAEAKSSGKLNQDEVKYYESALARNQMLQQEMRSKISEVTHGMASRQDAEYVYTRLAGEVEARNTQRRQGMTEAERKATPPSQTADVADIDVIVVYNGKEMHSVPMPANAEGGNDLKAGQLSNEQLKRLYQHLTQNLKNAPPLTVVRLPVELPFEAPADARGVHHRGTIYLVADNITSAQDARDVIAHEMIGHFGLNGFFGRELSDVLGVIHSANPRVRMLASKWKRENTDLIAFWKSKYGINDAQVQVRSTEEALATMAERGEKLSGWRRLAAVLQTLLRNIGAARWADALEAKTDAEALLALKKADMFVRKGAVRGNPWADISYAAFSRSSAEHATSSPAFSRAAAQTINEIKNKWKRAGIDAFVSERNGVINLLKIVVPKDSRSTGIGTKAMQQLVDYADSTGQRIELTPSADFGGSKSRLVQFYKRFGFVENKGSNKDYAISEAMYRAPETSNIRFSRAAAQPADNTPDTLTGLAASKFDDFLYKIQDKQIDTKRIVQSIKDTVGGINDALDTYLQETLFHGRAAKRTQDFVRLELGDLAKAMQAGGITKDAMEEYLHARHAQEANATLAERNPSQEMIDAGFSAAQQQVNALTQHLENSPTDKQAKRDLKDAQKELKKWRTAKPFKGTEAERNALSGMSNTEAQAVLSSLNPIQQRHMNTAAAMIDAIIAKTRQEMVEYGLESQETIDQPARSNLPQQRKRGDCEGWRERARSLV